MSNMIKENLEKDPQGMEIAGWESYARELSEERREIEAFVARRRKLEADDSAFMSRLKARLAPTLVELEPGKFAIIKPSKRQGIKSGGYVNENKTVIAFRDAAQNVVSLKRFEDYQILDEKAQWSGDEFAQNHQWFLELLKEMDEQKS